MMESKRTKYDTNPLDPEVARDTEKVWGQADETPPTGNVKGATTPVGPANADNARANAYSEAPTRTFNSPTSGDTSYPSVFVPPTYAPPASVYQPPPVPYQPPIAVRPPSRSVAGLGLPEKWAVMLPYIPYIGTVAALIELVLVPRSEVRVRGHAAQALALHIAIVAIKLCFSLLAAITGSSAGGSIFSFAAFIFLIISVIRVGQGKTHRITQLADPADWFNKHINPRA